MSYDNDPRLTSVAKQVRKLERAVSDADWDDDPHLEMLVQELNHYKDLENRGVLYEPKF